MMAVGVEGQPVTVFLDRDGVINANRAEYVRHWEDFALLPGVIPALALLADNGFRVVVVTNQAGINHGLIAPAELDAIHDRMCAVIANCGGRVDAVLHCPHRPDEDCYCRKPRPGLLYRAQQELGVDLATAILVGDHRSDLEAAHRAGCRSMLVLTGRTPDYAAERLPTSCIATVPDLFAAVEHLVGACLPRQEEYQPLRALAFAQANRVEVPAT
jgi:D-glycero-D-manno-heptose 1,7-bisphosphate phosphatase